MKKPHSFGDISLKVFILSTVAIACLVLSSVLFTEQTFYIFTTTKSKISSNFGWLYILAVSVFFIFNIVIAFSKVGSVKLGADGQEPDFTYLSWLAMLFSAGMGIGILFYGVSEPLYHYLNPITVSGTNTKSANFAMSTTFFHWGAHAWSIYCTVGLSLAYFHFRKNKPLSIRSALYPLFGSKINGLLGDLIDVMAIIGTLFGIATSLGLGSIQINSGLEYILGIENNIYNQTIIIIVVSIVAIFSVYSGIDKGVKRLSELNTALAFILLVVVMLLLPTVQILESLTQNISIYLRDIFPRTFNMYAYEINLGDIEKTSWLENWTLFYWAWWIAWAPFVGIFIAKISKGRTIREFVIGTVLVPTIITIVWFTVFGSGAIITETNLGSVAVNGVVDFNYSIFNLFQNLAFGKIISVVTIILIAMFFITSSDSGSLVIDNIACKGVESGKKWSRIYWAILEAIVAITLLAIGGEKALVGLQAASLIVALPFVIIILALVLSLMKSFKQESLIIDSRNISKSSFNEKDWRQRIKFLISYPLMKDIKNFQTDKVMYAFRVVASEIRSYAKNYPLDVNIKVSTQYDKKTNQASLKVYHKQELDFEYTVVPVEYDLPNFAGTKDGRKTYWKLEPHTRNGNLKYDIYNYSSMQIIHDILSVYEEHLSYLELQKTSEHT